MKKYSITGKSIIGYQKNISSEKDFKILSPLLKKELKEDFFIATESEVDLALNFAHKAFKEYRLIPSRRRADFLNEIINHISDCKNEIIERAHLETALPIQRLEGEMDRTLNQIKLFVNLILDGSYVNATIVADELKSKQDIRKMLIPIGPVAVFGASNFPLAFSTAGGDTISALAAGCPVIVKSHPAHAGTGELVATAICEAARKTKMPEGVFSNLNDSGYFVGQKLVKAKQIKAVAFTGSYTGGMELYKIACNRKTPIPVFAEMGSVNPLFVLPNYVKDNLHEFAKNYVASLTLGAGQFCTNPGLMFVIEGEYLEKLFDILSDEVQNAITHEMLTERIANNYSQLLKKALSKKEVYPIAVSEKYHSKFEANTVVVKTTGYNFKQDNSLQKEIFGPHSLIVVCKDFQEMLDIIDNLEGQLTASVFANKNETEKQTKLFEKLSDIAGRLILNDMPTGVQVCSAMHHGGPFPATSNSQYTSVGTDSIKRFLKPVCFQNLPDELLPNELRNVNKLKIFRNVNNIFTKNNLNVKS